MSKIMSNEEMQLEIIICKLKDSLNELDGAVIKYENQFKESMRYLWENRNGMDSMEIFSNEKSVSQIVNSGEFTDKRRLVVEKLIESPYFARIDFKLEDEETSEPIYIGRFSYRDKKGNMLIYDWRAPVSGMYYDFELGPAFYKAPVGNIEGEITLKRQFKIKNSRLEYALESSISINDEILQRELSHSADKRMKNIVETIQKEQNQIIRNEKADVLVIQGVAGSGKTSIALHRVAYFLYKYKDRLFAQDIMIISPNKVFASYISNVLPELGEEPIVETGFEEIASELLNDSMTFQTFGEQIDVILGENDEGLAERISFKGSMEFLTLLNEYIQHSENTIFQPYDYSIGKIAIPKEFIRDSYKAVKTKPVIQRLEEVAAKIIERVKAEGNPKQKLPPKKEILRKLYSMLKYDNCTAFYSGFYQYVGRPNLFVLNENNVLEASDVFPYIFLKMYFEGIKAYENVKHVIIDEMQDYTPVQYAVVKKLFTCKKTILGDFGQSVNPYNHISKDAFARLFDNAEFVALTKSYRSTYEIIKFAQKIQNHNIEPLERHGGEPEVISCRDKISELEEIVQMIDGSKGNTSGTIGILCRTSRQAEELFNQLSKKHEIGLLDFSSVKFKQGVTVTTIHMAKGLEFDEVIIPSVNTEIYKSDHDKSLLYIACTRAMHKLTLTYYGGVSPLLSIS